MRRGTVALLVVCQSCQSLVVGGIALFLPLIRAELAISFAQAGALAAAASFSYALMQLPSGYLADRFTPRRLFLIGLLGTNVLAFLFATLSTYPLLLVVQGLSGVFRALVFAPGMLLISDQFPANRRATALGLFVAGGFSSTVVLNLLGPVLVEPLGWRALFAIFAAAGLVLAALYRRAGDQRPRRPAGTRVRPADLTALLRERIVLVTGLIQFVRLAVAQGCTFWLPTYLVADHDYSLAAAGLVAAVGAALTAPANFLGGYLSDRLGRPDTVIRVSLGVLFVTVSLLAVVSGRVALLVVIGVGSLFVQVYFGPLFAVPVARLGTRAAGVLSGFGNLCANLGGFACAYGLGAIRDATGSFRAGYLTLAALCLLALVATRWLRADARG